MHLYAEQRVSYQSNMNICAAEAQVIEKPVLPSSSNRIPFQSPQILYASIVLSGGWDPLFSSMKDNGKNSATWFCAGMVDEHYTMYTPYS